MENLTPGSLTMFSDAGGDYALVYKDGQAIAVCFATEGIVQANALPTPACSPPPPIYSPPARQHYTTCACHNTCRT